MTPHALITSERSTLTSTYENITWSVTIPYHPIYIIVRRPLRPKVDAQGLHSNTHVIDGPSLRLPDPPCLVEPRGLRKLSAPLARHRQHDRHGMCNQMSVCAGMCARYARPPVGYVQPTVGICFIGNRLAIADSSNRRVRIVDFT